MLVDSKCSPPDIMVCYRVKKNGSNHHTSANAANAHVPANGLNNHQTINSMSLDPQAQAKQSKLGARGNALKQSKSRELRASIMYTGCDCEKRNGLQDDCLRSECRGSPQCLTKPNPTCGPSEFSNGKHLELKRLHMDRIRKPADHDNSSASDNGNTGHNSHNQGGKVNSKNVTGGNHADDCCCCVGEYTYYCVEGVIMDQSNDSQQQQHAQGGAKCPGTAQCGPGICPVGQCAGGVCAIGDNHKQNKENSIPVSGRGDTDSNKTACHCGGKEKSH